MYELTILFMNVLIVAIQMSKTSMKLYLSAVPHQKLKKIGIAAVSLRLHRTLRES